MKRVSIAVGPKAEPQLEPRVPTAQRLLDTAAKLFWTKGYASTTTREIAALRKEDPLCEICVTSLDRIREDDNSSSVVSLWFGDPPNSLARSAISSFDRSDLGVGVAVKLGDWRDTEMRKRAPACGR